MRESATFDLGGYVVAGRYEVSEHTDSRGRLLGFAETPQQIAKGSDLRIDLNRVDFLKSAADDCAHLLSRRAVDTPTGPILCRFLLGSIQHCAGTRVPRVVLNQTAAKFKNIHWRAR